MARMEQARWVVMRDEGEGSRGSEPHHAGPY